MHVFVLTGAGISAESGLKTFRDNDGLWENHRVEEIATPEAFLDHPERVLRFYNERRNALPLAQPNPAHKTLARLQNALGDRNGSLTLVTQNVDDLHERGGADPVVHMHGELNRGLCSACGFRWSLNGDLCADSPCPACGTVGTSRPDIVWFGEMPYHMDAIEAALIRADLFVSIGTSGAVYPAAGFVQAAKARSIATLELNMEPSLGSDHFDYSRYGPAGTIVPQWVDEMMSGRPKAF